MKLKVRGTVYTNDIKKSAHQLEERFRPHLEGRAGEQPDFEKFGMLFVSPSVHNPQLGKADERRSHSKKDDLYWVAQPVDYLTWTQSDWAGRTDAYASAVVAAIQRVPKSRLGEAERETLISLVEETRLLVRQTPPESVEPVGQTHVGHDEEGKLVSVSFSKEDMVLPSASSHTALSPEEAVAQAREAMLSAADEIEMLKLYKRVDGQLHCHEAWEQEGRIVEHWGACGTRGDIREHDFKGRADGKRLAEKVKMEASGRGFRTISPGDHATLVVEYSVEGLGSPADLERRHELEEYLNQLTGWLGLGHCDGGSTGSGTMEVFCIVVDFEIAKEALERELHNTRFSDYLRIYCME